MSRATKIARAAGIFILVVFVSAVILGSIEGWTPVDSFYVASLSCMCVGASSPVPVTSGGKIFHGIFPVLGIGGLLYFWDAVFLEVR